MQAESDTDKHHVFSVLNPIAGNADEREVEAVISTLCRDRGWTYEIYKTTGEENLAEITRQARDQKATIVLAAGGDGTISQVLNGLVNSEVPLGIIPVGTGNGLARALDIPINLEEVVALLSGEYHIRCIDLMQAKGSFYVLNVSAGISARAMLETKPEDKRRLGILAYAQNILRDLTGTEAQTFRLTLDGYSLNVQATEVLVSNGKITKEFPFLFGTPDSFTDGKLDLNILTAERPRDYVRLAWEMLVDVKEQPADLHDLTVRDTIVIDVIGDPQPVQADGEVIGETPVDVRIVKNALKVIVPATEEPDQPGRE